MFGKLPAHGDFIARGLSGAGRDAIDAWLAESLAAARAALGDDFESVYDRAPPWRCGAADMAGALAPSVDAVGRRYPIFVSLAGVAPERVASAAEACEALLFDALSDGWTADQLAAAVDAIEPEVGPAWDGPARWWTEGGEGFPPAILAGDRPVGLMRRVLTVDAVE